MPPTKTQPHDSKSKNGNGAKGEKKQPANPATTRSPFQAALNRLEEFATESLQPHVKTHILPTAKQYLHLQAKAHHKQKLITKMTDDEEFVPKSVRIGFEFEVSKECEEHADFAAIKNNAEEVLNDFKAKMKHNVIAAQRVETKIIEKQALNTLCKGFKSAIEALLIADNSPADRCDQVFSTIGERYFKQLSKHLKEEIDKKEFRKAYEAANEIASLPPYENIGIPNPNPPTPPVARAPTAEEEKDEATPTPWSTLATDMGLLPIEQALAQAEAEQTNNERETVTNPTNQPNPTIDENATVYKYFRIASSLIELFVAPWSTYLEREQTNKAALELRKLQQKKTEKDTDAAANELEKEASVDPKQLKELIKEETSTENRKLKKQLAELTKTVNYLEQKNSTARGQREQNQGASGKKKTRLNRSGKVPKDKKPEAKSTSKASKRPAEESNKDMRKSNGNKRRRYGNGKQNRKKQHSKKKQNE